MNYKVPRHKVVRNPEFRDVIYDENHWKLLKRLRSEALNIMINLIRCGFKPITHGSIARGDVNRGSDIDVVIPYVVQPYLVELCLEKHGLTIHNKYIIKATPKSTPKAYIELDLEGKRTVSFPLSKLSMREWEFYKFGGLITYDDIVAGKRVPGVNKSLILIIPTKEGHREAPVIGYEDYAAKVLNISIETVLERIRVLTKRDRYGRTGVFLKYILRSGESFEEALDVLKSKGYIDLT